MTHIDIAQSANAPPAGAGLQAEGAGPAAPGGVTASGGPAQADPGVGEGPSETAALRAEAEGSGPLVAGHPHEGVGAGASPPSEGSSHEPLPNPTAHDSDGRRGAGPGPAEPPRQAHEGADPRRGRVREEPFLSVQAELNRWFEEFWRQASGLGMSPALRAARPLAALSPASMFGLPAVDVKEGDAAWRVCAELPGLKAEDIDVEIRGESLVIAGHKSEEKDDHRAAFRVSERRFGRFERRFPIPPDVDRDRIEATFRDGLLTVTLPRVQAAPRTSRIEIRR